MKNLKRLLVCCSLLICVLFTATLSAAAATPQVGQVANTVVRVSGAHRAYIFRKDVLTSWTRVNDRHSKYITTTWAKSDNYTVSSSKSYTVSASGDVDTKTIVGFGLETSIETTKGVSISIPANKSRYSKLALRADYYKVVYTRYYYNSSGAVTKSTKYTVYTPIKGTAEYYIKYQ